MSSPVIPPPSEGQSPREAMQGRQNSIGRAFKRLKVAFQRIGSFSRDTTSRQPSTSAGPIDTLVVDEDEEETSPGSAEIPNLSMNLEVDLGEETPEEPLFGSTEVYIRGKSNRQRAHSLFLKYGLSAEDHDWVAVHSPANPSSVLRVEKPIRMRIRHTCHVCKTLFGAERSCRKCQHRRCLECPRHPPKKRSRQSQEEDKENQPDDNSDEERGSAREEKMRSREGSPSNRPPSVEENGGASSSSRPVVQRIQRVCHNCQTDFESPTAQLCMNCGHLQCHRCPRRQSHHPWSQSMETTEVEPEQPLWRPERVFRKPRQRVRWTCEQCQTTFLEGTKVCRECLHRRCDGCVRTPPKRIKRDTDSQSRMSSLSIPSSPMVPTSFPVP